MGGVRGKGMVKIRLRCGYRGNIGTAGFMTHGFLSNDTGGIEINKLPLGANTNNVQGFQIRVQYPFLMHVFDTMYQLHKYMPYFLHVFPCPPLLF